MEEQKTWKMEEEETLGDGQRRHFING